MVVASVINGGGSGNRNNANSGELRRQRHSGKDIGDHDGYGNGDSNVDNDSFMIFHFSKVEQSAGTFSSFCFFSF